MKPLRRLPLSLKTVSKRISRLFLPAALLLLPVLLYAEDSAHYSIDHSAERVAIAVTAADFNVNEVKSSVTEGSNAEIRFRIRIYRERRGIASLLGDALLYEHTVIHTGTRDIFSTDYILRSPERHRRFDSFDRFLNAFTTARHSIPRQQLPAGKELLLLYQVEVTPRTLVPPFTLLRPFMPGITQSTPWLQAPLQLEEEAAG